MYIYMYTCKYIYIYTHIYIAQIYSVGFWSTLLTCCEKLAETRQDAESRGRTL